ncbi:MAG: 4-hydroxy-tetrahydrodipicolinate reductase [Leptospiraceae bacterium]|nr:4-hydroxy-tetrahydrodipicolinate reductase [Leptospiraceae bacterium]
MIKIGISGALGRMGRTIGELALKDQDFSILLALERENHPSLNSDYGETLLQSPKQVYVTSSPEPGIQNTEVIIDFSNPENTIKLLPLCEKYQKAMVIGTTGFQKEQLEVIQESSKKIPILLSPNMSLGVNLLFHLVELTAKVLKKQFEVEIMEIHHSKKKDSPSGTAVKLKDIILQEHGWDESKTIYGRKGMIGERPSDEVGIHALRGGDVVGEHTVFFFGEGERIEITHRATSRVIFAKGALFAAKWIYQKPPGFYTMKDALNL